MIKAALFAAWEAARMRGEGDVGRERPPLPPPGDGPGPAPTGVAHAPPCPDGRSRAACSRAVHLFRTPEFTLMFSPSPAVKSDGFKCNFQRPLASSAMAVLGQTLSMNTIVNTRCAIPSGAIRLCAEKPRVN